MINFTRSLVRLDTYRPWVPRRQVDAERRSFNSGARSAFNLRERGCLRILHRAVSCKALFVPGD